MRAAIREQIKKVRSRTGTDAEVERLSSMLQSRNAAAKSRAAERGGQQDLFGSKPAPRGPSPFEVRAKAAAERRAAMVASAQQRTGRLPVVLGGAARGMMAQRKAAAEATATWEGTRVNGKTSTEWMAHRAEIEKRKPKPLSTYARQSPSMVAEHNAKKAAWKAEHKAATENFQKAAANARKAFDAAAPAQREMLARKAMGTSLSAPAKFVLQRTAASTAQATAQKAAGQAEKQRRVAGSLGAASAAMLASREAAAKPAPTALDRYRQQVKAAASEKERGDLSAMTNRVRDNMTAGRAALAGAPKPRGGLERTVVRGFVDRKASVQNVRAIAKSGDFFVHKSGGFGSGYGVTHRPSGTTIYQSHSVSAARAAMDGVAKSGSKILSRIEGGDMRAAKALSRYTRGLESAKFYNAANRKYDKRT
jgi:hypothetical protein